MNDRLLRAGTTYLPHRFSREALEHFGFGDFRALLSELDGQGASYERVGVDRALAIAVDLALQGAPKDAAILDVGCSVGTIAILLSQIGYQVTGIDSDVVARVQQWQDEAILRGARERWRGSRCRLVQADLRDHLAASQASYDVALLLSVLHHWLPGYGYTGQSSFTRAELGDTLERLCDRVSSFLYIEVPIADELTEMPPDSQGELLFPGWFLERNLARNAEVVASTVATNGKPRRLFRVDLR